MMLFSLKIKQMNKFPDYLFQLSKDYDTIEEICIEGLAIERLKFDIKDLNELREPMVVLLSRCKVENSTGGCIDLEHLTVSKFNNLKCEAIANQEIVEEAEWFYILDSYPIRDKETEDIIFQKFSMKTNFKLKYPLANPFSI